jgi:peptidoglycan/xylan/chitin deacetylase (PgdA/CDA1 family)
MLVLALAGLSGQAQARERNIFVVFRYDDYCDNTPTELEVKLIEAFATRGISCTFAVVPQWHGRPSLGAAKADILRRAHRAGVVDVALHGYTHARQANRRPEFLGLDYASQETRIAKGKKFLEDVLELPVTEFVPPHNWYDLNTVDVLEKAGFTCLSADLAGPARASSPLKFLPTTCGPVGLREAVGAARKARLPSTVVVVLFHDFDFREAKTRRAVVDLNEFTRMLDWTLSQEDIAVCGSVRRATQMIDDLGAQRYLWNHSVYEMRCTVPPFLREDYVAKVYLPAETARATRNRLIAIIGAFNLALLALSLAVSSLAAAAVFARRKVLAAATPWVTLVVLGATAVYALRGGAVGFKGAAAVAVLAGAWFGTSLAALRVRSRGRKAASPPVQKTS